MKEVRLLSKLQHPNVVEFKGVSLNKYTVLFHLRDVEIIERMLSVKPLICNLVDFGESQSKEICTQQIKNCKTAWVNRGK